MHKPHQCCCITNGVEDEAGHHQCEWQQKYEQAKTVLEATKASLAAAHELIQNFEKASLHCPVDNNSKITIQTPFLPAEMWMKVFGFITHPQDYLNCSNTCKRFQDLLEENKVAALLPQVIQILSNHQKRYYSSNFTGEEIRRVGISLRNIELTSDDLRKCRLVCKSWRCSVNRHISYHPSIETLFLRPEFDEINYTEYFTTSLPIVLYVDSPEKVKSILAYLDTPKLKFNLLSSRHLVIKQLQFLEDYAVENNQEKHPLLTLLEKVGSSIWYLAVDNETDEFNNPGDIIEWYEMLVKCLNLLPNLRSLVIFQANYTIDVEELPKAKTRTHPIPHFPHLKVVQLDSVSENLYSSLLKTNGHIKKLRMSSCGAQYSGCPPPNFWKNANLTRNLTEFSLGIYVEDSDDIIGTLKLVKWPLTKLSLDGYPVYGKVLFETLERFRHSLTHLYVMNLFGPSVKIMTPFPNLCHVELLMKSTSDDNSWYGLDAEETEEDNEDDFDNFEE